MEGLLSTGPTPSSLPVGVSIGSYLPAWVSIGSYLPVGVSYRQLYTCRSIYRQLFTCRSEYRQLFTCRSEVRRSCGLALRRNLSPGSSALASRDRTSSQDILDPTDPKEILTFRTYFRQKKVKGSLWQTGNNNPIQRVWASIQRQSQFWKLCGGKILREGKYAYSGIPLLKTTTLNRFWSDVPL